MANQWLIIGIAGISCGGKSTLANQIRDKYKNCIILSQDQYFLPYDSPLQIMVKGLDHINKDVLNCVDMEKMFEDVLEITSRDSTGPPQGGGTRILIVEGFCVLSYAPIADICELKYELSLTKEQARARRSVRVYRFPDLPEYFDLCVWPEFVNYHEELKKMPGVVTMSGMDGDLAERVFADIEACRKPLTNKNQ